MLRLLRYLHSDSRFPLCLLFRRILQVNSANAILNALLNQSFLKSHIYLFICSVKSDQLLCLFVTDFYYTAVALDSFTHIIGSLVRLSEIRL